MTKFSPVHRFIVLALLVAMTVTASAQNVAPVAVDDTASTSEDISLNSTVTPNDSDVDGPAANYALATTAANGALTLNPDGTYIYTPAANYNGIDSFTYSLCDGGIPDLCDTATVFITITAVNDAPIVSNDTNTTNEDVPVNGTILTLADSDPDGTLLTVDSTSVSVPSNGSITVHPDGTYTYTPALNFFGTEVIVISVCDNGTPLPALCANDTLTITVSAVNDAPVANDDVNSTNEDTPVNGTTVSNDSDVDGPAANYTAVASAVNGSALVNADGTYTYTPAVNFNGVDSFTYSLCDGGTPDLCDTATVVITVSAVNDAPVANDDVNSTNEDSPVNGSTVSNDSDVDGPAANYTAAASPVNGSVLVNSAGTYTYTPVANFYGVDSFTYSLCDGGTPDLCDTATVVITVSAVNDAPVALDDTNSTIKNTSVNGAVASNDSDIDGPASNYALGANAINGNVTMAPDGAYIYTPNSGFTGVDSFTYSLCDGGTPDLCDTAAVVITVSPVNTAPMISNDSTSTNEDNAVSGNVITASDSDPDGTTLSANTAPVSGPAYGAIVINTDGTYTYTPNPNFNGLDAVIISVCDSGLPLPAICKNDTLIINVLPVNDPPIIANDVNTTAEDSPVSGTVLTLADSDPDGTTLTATTAPVSGPSNGGIVINSDGTYTYTPGLNFNGTDVVVIAVCDSGTPLPAICTNDTLTITVTSVNDAPIVANDVNTTNEDTPVSGTILTGADSDPDGTSLRANTILVSPPAHGTVFVSASGNYTYIPFANFNGTDVIVIAVCDSGTPLPSLCSNDTLIITVTPVNDAPVAVTDTNSTVESSPVSGTVATNDIDIDGPSANYSVVNNPAHGTLVLNTNGSYTYTPGVGYTGVDTFTYVLCDGGTPDLCDTAAVFITVRIRNARPDAVNDTIAATEDTLLSGSVGNNDTDPDGPGALFGVNTQPSHGTLSLGVNGLYIYTPSANYNGPDSFSYVLCDGGIPNLCDTATVYINIAAVNDAPVANDDNNTTALNTAVTGDVKPNDSDVDGPAATYSIAVVPSHGSLVLTDSGTYLYTPATDYVGCDTARISLCDGGTPNLCDTSLLVICTISGNVAPGAQNDYGQAQINTAITLNILANDSDLNGNLGTTPTILSNPTHGNVVVNADGTVTYTPTADFAGLDTFSYIICDGGTPVLCDTAQVFITVVRQAGIVGVPIVTQTDSAVATCLSYTAAVYDSAGTIATVSCGPRHGRAVITTIDSINHELCFTYTPDSGYYGVDTFCVTLCQGGSCSTATMPVTINSKTNICYWLKGISPNGDGQNDDFYVNCNDSYPNSTLKVFNRWGDQVWDSNGHYTNNFEGKNGRGEVLPDGTYYYIYYLNDGSKDQHAGFIQVSR